MKQQAISTIIAAAMLLTLVMFNPASAQKLTLGNEGTYPPFSILGTDGSVTGIEPDLAREMCKRMGAECEIVAMDFSALLPSLISGKIDMIISQLTPLPERLEATEFTLPVVFSPEGFVVPKDWNKGFDNEAMSGMKLGVYKASSHAKYVEVNLPAAQPVYFENNDQMALDLLAGRIDGVFGHKINWQILLIDTPDGSDWKLSGPDFWAMGEREGMSWAAQKGKVDLVKKVNEALESMIADCTYTKIRKQYIAVQMLDEESKCM
jgi:ABC-type amino acid transport substrate-binding protein